MNYDEVEKIARWLCEEDGNNPDEYYTGFNRNAAYAVDCFGEWNDWEDSIFPKTYLWQEYESEALKIYRYIEHKEKEKN